jgi:hypothetical protein
MTTKGVRINEKDRLMHQGFHNNSYKVNTQVKYKLEKIIMQKP